jgi:hypothetical protein
MDGTVSGPSGAPATGRGQRLRARSSWQEHALLRADQLEEVMCRATLRAAARGGVSPELLEANAQLGRYLAIARGGAGAQGGHGLRTMWTGADVDRCASALHAAEALVARHLDDTERAALAPALLARVTATLQVDDPRRVAAEQWLAGALGCPAGPVPVERYVEALHAVDQVADGQLTRVRSFRNVVIASTVILTLVAVGAALIGVFAPGSLHLCFTPEGRRVCPTGGSGPTGGDLALVEMLGLVGAALSAAVAIRALRGTSTPFAVPAALAVLKLPTGCLTALVGLLLIRGQFVPGLSAIDSQEQIIAYAVLFGYAQQIATRLVDRQGQEVLNRVSGAEPSPPDQRRPAQAPSRMPTPAHPPVPSPAPPSAEGPAGPAPDGDQARPTAPPGLD